MPQSTAQVETFEAFYPGDIVELKTPDSKLGARPLKVTKFLRTNVQAVAEDGQVWRVPFYALKRSTQEFKVAAFTPVIGGIVTCQGLTGYHVVTDVKSGLCRIALLGGNENRYYKNIGIGRLADANGEVLGKL